MDIFSCLSTLNVDRKEHFWTTYPPHLVHVVIERPPKGVCDTESTAQPGDFLSVHYTGRFDDENGEIFDTSHKRGQLYKFQLGAGRVRKKNSIFLYLWLEEKKSKYILASKKHNRFFETLELFPLQAIISKQWSSILKVL